MTKVEKAGRDEAIAKLREWIKPGDTVHTILRHVSRSGMQREIGVVLLKDGTDLHPNYLLAKALGERVGKRDGVVVGGCGMDMGFHLVYSLSRVLFPTGFGCIGERCPSNDHFNGDRDYTRHSHCGRCGSAFIRLSGGAFGCAVHGIVSAKDHDTGDHWHKDGGYALRHRWL